MRGGAERPVDEVEETRFASWVREPSSHAVGISAYTRVGNHGALAWMLTSMFEQDLRTISIRMSSGTYFPVGRYTEKGRKRAPLGHTHCRKNCPNGGQDVPGTGSGGSSTPILRSAHGNPARCWRYDRWTSAATTSGHARSNAVPVDSALCAAVAGMQGRRNSAPQGGVASPLLPSSCTSRSTTGCGPRPGRSLREVRG